MNSVPFPGPSTAAAIGMGHVAEQDREFGQFARSVNHKVKRAIVESGLSISTVSALTEITEDRINVCLDGKEPWLIDEVGLIGAHLGVSVLSLLVGPTFAKEVELALADVEPAELTEQQRDGHACRKCGREFGVGSTSKPAGYSNGRQLFECSDGWGCSAEVVEWIDLLCSTCTAVVGTAPAPLPDVAVKCQQCNRAATCALFCNLGDGHLGEMLDDDRVCWGPDHLVPLTLEPQYYPQAMPAVEVSAHRQWGGRDSVYLACPNGDVDMTVAEARRLAAVLMEVAEQVEAEGARS
ncbi:hypothetical protein [Nocardia sp. R7R-8]|uniref:hypothetical protein n=1 Tax=Nocardia sp. R7R-8 TaxID=3459304 RepID=UPI00403D6FCB